MKIIGKILKKVGIILFFFFVVLVFIVIVKALFKMYN
jgi:hypothetical protein